jgi:hypothetical protein
MSLNKAIKYGKEKRKPYRKAKAVDCSCRNHGSCDWCKSNRTIQSKKEEQRIKDLSKINDEIHSEGLVSLHSINTKEEFDEMMSKEDERIRKYFEKKNLEKEQNE